MEDLLAARLQMAVSLGFHMLFAVVGMAMPAMMVCAQLLHRRTGDVAYLQLAKRWAKGTAILFAVGAVSGTVLSFELGLLWPGFMELTGPLVGFAFSLEGYAFFLEAIALGLYLYGWDRLSPRVHLAAGVVVAVSGLLSGVFVTSVNGFMNAPAGFLDGVPHDPIAAFFNDAFFTEALHTSLSAYASVAVAVLGVHAWRARKNPSAFHRAGMRIAFGFALVFVPLLLASGDLAAKHICEHQPTKLAALEAHFETEANAGLSLFGVPSQEELRYAVRVPGGLSFLCFMDFDATVEGLHETPVDERPPVAVVYIAFRIMVGCGSLMLALVAFGLWLTLRKRPLSSSPLFLKAAMFVAPLGLLAVEAGWTVTEVGRQPWVVYGMLRTADAVTPMPGIWVSCLLFCLLYLALGAVVVTLLNQHVVRADDD